MQVISAEGLSGFQPQFLHEGFARIGNIILHNLQQPLHRFGQGFIFIGKLNRDLIQNLIDLPQHKLDKNGGLPRHMTFGNRFVVFLLKFFDLAFDGNVLKNRLPLGKDRRVPQSCHSAVAVREGMNEYELIMKDAAEDQRMYLIFCRLHPVEQIRHQPRDELGRRCHENTPVAAENAIFASAKLAGFFHQVLCHDPVELFQLLNVVGVDLQKSLISLIGTLDFLNFLLLPQNRLAIDDIPNLSQCQGVCLDLQGRMNGFNFVVLPQMRPGLQIAGGCDPSDFL